MGEEKVRSEHNLSRENKPICLKTPFPAAGDSSPNT